MEEDTFAIISKVNNLDASGINSSRNGCCRFGPTNKAPRIFLTNFATGPQSNDYHRSLTPDIEESFEKKRVGPWQTDDTFQKGDRSHKFFEWALTCHYDESCSRNQWVFVSGPSDNETSYVFYHMVFHHVDGAFWHQLLQTMISLWVSCCGRMHFRTWQSLRQVGNTSCISSQTQNTQRTHDPYNLYGAIQELLTAHQRNPQLRLQLSTHRAPTSKVTATNVR